MPGLCRSAEGWGPTSVLRAFDLTPCFEEALAATLLAALFVSGLIRYYTLSKKQTRERLRPSRWILWAKVVSWSRSKLGIDTLI